MNEFLDSVLIIDDNYEEVSSLEKELSELDIWVTYKHPDELDKGENFLRNRKLIILDLSLRDTYSVTENIGWIRALLKNTLGPAFGSYGILLWTKHDDDFKEFEKKIHKSNGAYPIPLFTVCLGKDPYLKSNDYSNIIQDILAVLKKNRTSHFFVTLDVLLKKGKYESLNSFVEFVNESEHKSQDLTFLLDEIAKNYSGIPSSDLSIKQKTQHIIKAFCEMLYYDVIKYSNKDLELFEEGEVAPYSGADGSKLNAYSKINSKLLIDIENIDQAVVSTGNIYEVLVDSSGLRPQKFPDDARLIAIEITPPCDYASGNRRSPRLIGGYLKPYSEGGRKNAGKSPKLYAELRSLEIPDVEVNQMLIFDYLAFETVNESDLKDASRYKLLFGLKDRTTADIIQKFSAYSSRLGIPTVP